MLLRDALAVKRGDIITIVGAGGKTTTMFRLARELTEDGWRVVTTTTTLIRPREGRRGERLIVESEQNRLLAQISGAMDEHRHVTVASQRLMKRGDRLPRLGGITPELVAAIGDLPAVDAVIVEGDGCRGRLLKAPADHEPVVPRDTTILVPMAGVDALGRPLTEQWVHRPERVARLAGVSLGDEITPQVVADTLADTRGGLKGVPEGARVVPLINKVEGHDRLAGARQIAERLLGSPVVDRVVLGAVLRPEPVVETWGRIAAVILAAGGSTRFGSDKLLALWGEGTIIEHVTDTVLASGADEVIVVQGHDADKTRAILGDRPVRTVINEQWAQGLSTSVRAGLNAVNASAHAALFVLADKPAVTTEDIAAVMTGYRTTLAPIVVPTYDGQPGNPVLFDRALFGELASIEGDEGGRQLRAAYADRVHHVAVASPGILLDIDTPADYERVAASYA
ncbi:MAG: selenium cofactor biosynthesis protein YqeC [Armatimonadota bacterium]